MVKAYLKYEQIAGFGVVASSAAVAVPVPNVLNAPLVATAAIDALLVWNLRLGQSLASFSNRSTRKAGAISCIAVSSDGETIAAGYTDGSIRLWSFDSKNKQNQHSFSKTEPQPIATFNGHRSGISALTFCAPDPSKLLSSNLAKGLLASGSNDGDIVIWDMVAGRGIFRLPAHKNAVTALVLFSFRGSPYVVSASKDGLVKVHDTETQHCVQVITGHRSEVWSLAMDPTSTVLLTGGVGAEIHGFVVADSPAKNSDTEAGASESDVFYPIGVVQRKVAADRVAHISISKHLGQTFVVVCASDNNAELFRLHSEEEAKAKRKKKKRKSGKKKEKETNSAIQVSVANPVGQELDKPKSSDKLVLQSGDVELSDYLMSVRQLRMKKKLRSITCLLHSAGVVGARGNGNDIVLLVQQKDNSLEVHSIHADAAVKKKKRIRVDESETIGAKKDIKKVLSLNAPGHRGEVRSIAISPDGNSMLSVAGDALKLWNVSTGRCIRTVRLKELGMSATFAGADGRIGLVGCKNGFLQAYDLGSGELLCEEHEAHSGEIWSMCLDNHIYEATSVITGGADKKVCIWSLDEVFEAVENSETEGLELLKTLVLPDEVLCVKVAYARDRPLLLVSMMDCTARAFFLDTFEPYLSFYGHRLPVMSMDVSSDGLLLVTGSADKTVKVWGMDFGDCRRSMRAHSDSVLSVAFQPKTHYFFSGSRDGALKYWDGDKFELITNLEGQRGNVYCVATSDDGELVASGSQDRMLRVWQRTDEPIFLEEERDKRQDEMFENTLLEDDMREAAKRRAAERDGLTDEIVEQLSAGKRSLETVKGGERILETLKLCREEQARVAQNEEEAANPLLLGLSAEAYMLRTLEAIKTADMEETLHILPLNAAVELLGYCCDISDRCRRSATLSTEMLTRIALFLVKLHHSQLTAGAANRKVLVDLQRRLGEMVQSLRERVGVTNAALEFWQIELESRDDKPFRDAAARAYNMLKSR